MYNLKAFAEKIKDFRTVYEAGGIQHKKNPDTWREDFSSFLEKNGKVGLNPFADNERIFNPSVMGYKSDGTVYQMDELIHSYEDKHAILLRQTELNDLYIIEKIADICLFYLDESASFGTATELKMNYDHFHKPMIIVRNISRLNLPHWITWRRYKAIMEGMAIEFRTLTEAKQFFIDYLGFKE